MISRQQPLNSLDFRKRQIDTLKVFNDNVVEVIENEEYAIPFESGGRNFLLSVQLGNNFPSERPKIRIAPVAFMHPWLNTNNGEIEGAPGLLNYTPHSDLGRIVQAVIREYERYPPPSIENSKVQINHQPSSTTSTTTTTTTTNIVPITGQQQQQKQQQLQQQQQKQSLDNCSSSSKENSPLDRPICSNKLTESSVLNLSTLSLDELKQLDNDPQFFDDFIEEMSVVQKLNKDLDTMINQVETISRENEAKDTNLIELKRKLSDDVTTLKNLGEKCDQLNKKYLKKSDNFAPQHIRELLQIAASNADTECDHHVEEFLNGKIDVQTFLNSYAHSKKISSERKAKEERLGQQLTAFERAGI